MLPTGGLDVTVGEPVASVDAEDTKDGDALDEVDGRSWLPVSWSYDLGAAPWSSALARDPETADVSVAVDGRSYAVGSPYHVAGQGVATVPDDSFYVLVPGAPTPDEVTVDVTYGGHDVSGLADLATDRPAGVPCGTDGFETSGSGRTPAELDCDVTSVGTTPYYPGAGWAADGQVFSVVQVSQVRLLSAAPRSVIGIEDRSTIAGVRPVVTLGQQERPREYVAAGMIVAPVPVDATGPLRLDLVFDLDDGTQVEAVTTVRLSD